MPSTYMNLTNKLLRLLKEVELTESDFPSATGIQATAKDCIVYSVNEINLKHTDWPFNAVQHSQTLVAGTEEYAWPADFTMADWYSFQLQKDDTLNVESRMLRPIEREEWYLNLKDRDDDSESDGVRRPIYVAPSHGQGFVVTPSPDEAYPIKYRYWKQPTDLSLFDDEVTIPARYDYVIVQGAVYYLNLFKENAEAAQLSENKFEKGVATMAKVLLPNSRTAFVSRMNTGNSHRSTSRGIWTGY